MGGRKRVSLFQMASVMAHDETTERLRVKKSKISSELQRKGYKASRRRPIVRRRKKGEGASKTERKEILEKQFEKRPNAIRPKSRGNDDKRRELKTPISGSVALAKAINA